MTKIRELREMGEEQIRLVWKDAAESLFKLRIQAQTEKLASPAEVRKHRRTIARCQTLLGQRGVYVGTSHAATGPGAATHGEDSPEHRKHAKKPKAKGRAKIGEESTGRIGGKRQFQKRTQSGN
jgi:large subunit ribosomal protein L29